MKIASNSPPPVSVPNEGRGPLKLDLTYRVPVEAEQTLGNIPQDGYSKSYPGPFETVDCSGQACQVDGGQPVKFRGPSFDAEGNPILTNTIVSLEAETTDPGEAARKSASSAAWKGALFGGVGGALVAALADQSLAMGGALGALAVGGVAAVVSGVAAHREAASERLAVEWREVPLQSTQMVGYSKQYEHNEDGVGYDVVHQPVLAQSQAGSYFEPVILRYREGETPAIPPAPAPQAPAQPEVLDLGWSESGLATNVNTQGQFITAGNSGVVHGRLEEGKTLYDYLRHSDGSLLDLGWSESGLGAALNDSGRFVVAGNSGIVQGQINGRETSFQPLQLNGENLDLGWSESGLAASVNNSGQYVVAGNSGVAFGTLGVDGSASCKLMTNGDGSFLDLGWSQSGLAATINESGQFIVAGNSGVVFGAIDDQGQASFQTLMGPDGEPLDLGWSESGLGASLNDRGEFVVAGNSGVVQGRIQGGQASCSYITDSNGELLDLGWSESGLGATVNNHGQFMVAGNSGIVHGELNGGQPSYQFLTYSDGELLDLGWSESGLGVSLNDSGRFSVAGNSGVVSGKVEGGQASWHFVRGA